MLNWADRFNICSFLDNHLYEESHHTIECVLAAGATESLSLSAGHAFPSLFDFHQQHKDWLFGHFAYDLKNELEDLRSENPDGVDVPDLYFFLPQYVLQLSKQQLSVGSLTNDHTTVFNSILETDPRPTGRPDFPAEEGFRGGQKPVIVASRYTKSDYLQTVEQIQQHILRGDCYELNLCQEFYVDDIIINPLQFYQSLSNMSPNPFSAYYKIPGRYVLCMSPERYLKKQGRKILSQPVKGTAKRNIADPEADQKIRQELEENEKERAENIMVVDLVRNDLSKISAMGTVQVEELCGVHSFPQVHQMISTITGLLREDLSWSDAIRDTFPMGSMTGAPKKKVMELIEKYERSRRGLFSGSIGYITPEGDFDLNVVIRSVLYNQSARYLSFHAGSAVTFNSDAGREYEECLLKAEIIKKALAEANTFH